MSDTKLMRNHVVIGEKYYSLLKKPLEELGYIALSLPDNPFVDSRLSGHADLSFFSCGNDTIFMAPYLKNSDFASFVDKLGYNILFADVLQEEKYPNDAQLNICALKEHFIYNPKTSCPEITKMLKEQGREGIACKQGYAKCSVCVINDRSIITADRSIAHLCANAGIDVLEIAPGGVTLDGFDYGFIGGASIKLPYSMVAFTGRLDMHPDAAAITGFIKERGVDIIYLTDLPAFDIGSAFII